MRYTCPGYLFLPNLSRRLLFGEGFMGSHQCAPDSAQTAVEYKLVQRLKYLFLSNTDVERRNNIHF